MPTVIEQLQDAIANDKPISDELRAQALADIETAEKAGSTNFPRIVRGLLSQINGTVKIVLTERIAQVVDEPKQPDVTPEAHKPSVGVSEILQVAPQPPIIQKIHGR